MGRPADPRAEQELLAAVAAYALFAVEPSDRALAGWGVGDEAAHWLGALAGGSAPPPGQPLNGSYRASGRRRSRIPRLRR